MQRVSGTVLRDIRNMRKHNTYNVPGSSDQRRDSYDGRVAAKFVINDEMREKELKIKSFDEKLETHKNEIERNNEKIAELGRSVEVIREQLTEQTQLTQAEEKKCKHLREELERTNRLLRSKNNKLRLTKKLQVAEKEAQDLKSSAGKAQDLAKNLTAARRQSQNLERSLEEVNGQKKSMLKEKDAEIAQLREYLNTLKLKQSQEDELRRINDAKDSELYMLRSENSNMMLRLEKESAEFQHLKASSQSMRRQLEMSLENERTLSTQEKRYHDEKREFESMKERLKTASARLEELKGIEVRLRAKEIEVAELKLKSSERADTIEQMRLNQQRAFKDKDGVVDNLRATLTAQQAEAESQRATIASLTKASSQLQSIRGKSEQLNTLYNNLIPPLQCNLCHHSMTNPITVIPCGHNYCLNCKKGYTKACFICNDKVKIEAVYRNELLDDIAQVVKSIKELILMVR